MGKTKTCARDFLLFWDRERDIKWVRETEREREERERERKSKKKRERERVRKRERERGANSRAFLSHA